MHSVVAVGHAPAVADLIGELRREKYHGLRVVGACVAAPECAEIAGVPVYRRAGQRLTAVVGVRRRYGRGARLPGDGRDQAA